VPIDKDGGPVAVVDGAAEDPGGTGQAGLGQPAGATWRVRPVEERTFGRCRSRACGARDPELRGNARDGASDDAAQSIGQ
jgi:hypothetical protein